MTYTIAQITAGIAFAAEYDSGATVSATLYNAVTGSTVTLTAGTTAEIGSTGTFVWVSTDIETMPTELTNYILVLDDTTTKTKFKFSVDNSIDEMLSILQEIQTIAQNSGDNNEWFKKFLRINRQLIKSLSNH